VFTNRSIEEEIYPLTAQNVADTQRVDATIKHCFKSNHVFDKDFDIRLVDNPSVVCKNGKMVIPKPLQWCVVLWFHHYLQHPGHTCLAETMQAMMYWKGIPTTILSITKSCKACQVNKKRKLKYGHLPPKTIITTPWRTLCVNLVGPYTLKDKDGSVIDFMALTMIDPASSWFKIVELPLVRRLKTTTVDGRELLASEEIFDKSSDCIVQLVIKFWFSRYPRCQYLVYNNGSEFKLNLNTYVTHMVLIHKQMQYWSTYIKSLDKCYAQLKLIWPIQ
jgi:hypothetical protein